MAASFTGEGTVAPLVRTIRSRHDTDAAAGTDYGEVIGAAPFDGVVSGVRFLPDAAVSGATTTATTWTVANKTKTLNAAALAFITATDLVAFTAKTITNSGTAANLVCAAGDVYALVKTHASTGTAMPSGSIEIDFSANSIL